MSSSTSSAADVPYFEFGTAIHVPETYVWSGPHNYPTVEAVGRDVVPVVDMSDAPDAVVRAVAHASKEWGGFLLVGHGVPAGTVARVQEQTARLFACPAHEKTRSNSYGLPPSTLHFDKLTWSEWFVFHAADIRSEFRHIWPDGGDDYLRFCVVMEEYHREMRAASGRLLDMFYRALGLTNHQIATSETERKISDTLTAMMRLNLYPKCPDPEHAMGLAAHIDLGFFTFVMHSLVPGLQLFRLAPDRWVTVRAQPGAFTVVIGNMFHLFSNGRFHSVLHRVIVNNEQERISVPYFLISPNDMVVEPLASAMLPGTKSRFRAVTWPGYIVLRKKTFRTDMLALDMLQIAIDDGEEEAHQN